jgi:hypothetical protein
MNRFLRFPNTTESGTCTMWEKLLPILELALYLDPNLTKHRQSTIKNKEQRETTA